MDIAKTILQQLGGNRFLAMTGARNLVADYSGLTMQLPRNRSKANRMTVRLDGNDTYQMSFWRLHNYNVQNLIVHEGIYCDQLQQLFTEATGFDTNMGALIRA